MCLVYLAVACAALAGEEDEFYTRLGVIDDFSFRGEASSYLCCGRCTCHYRYGYPCESAYRSFHEVLIFIGELS